MGYKGKVGEIKDEYCTYGEQALLSFTQDGIVIRFLTCGMNPSIVHDFLRNLKIGFSQEKDFLIIGCRGKIKNYIGFYSPNVSESERILLPVRDMGYQITLILVDSSKGETVAVRNVVLAPVMTRRLCSAIMEIVNTGTYDKQEWQQAVTYYKNCNQEQRILSAIYMEYPV